MIAQLILTLLLFGILFYAWWEYLRSPAVGLLAWGAGLAGLYFVWVPSHATRLAEWVGIGRGVDLVIYTWIGISLIVLLNLHLKIRAQMELITALARAIALANAPRAVEDGNAVAGDETTQGSRLGASRSGS
jgi:small membrane protein